MIWRPHLSVIEQTSAAFAQRLLGQWRALPSAGWWTFGFGVRIGMTAGALQGLQGALADPGLWDDTADPAQLLWVVLTVGLLVVLMWLSHLSVLRHATVSEITRPTWGRLIWGSLRLHVIKWAPLWMWSIGMLALALRVAPGLDEIPADLAADPVRMPSLQWEVWLLGLGVLIGFPVVVAWSLVRCLMRLASDGDLARGLATAPPVRGHRFTDRWWECLIVVGLTLALDAMATLSPWPAWGSAIALHTSAGLWALASVTWSRARSAEDGLGGGGAPEGKAPAPSTSLSEPGDAPAGAAHRA